MSIITSKAQTTRHRIIGIVNGPDYQIVFSDTPGVLKPKYKLQESMLNFSSSALVDADILLYMTDTIEKIEKNESFLEKVKQATVPVLAIINKIDLSNEEALQKQVQALQAILPSAEVIPLSVLHKFGLDYLMKRILALLPESPPYFGKDALTDRPARFFVSEIIREKILLYYQQEIPYAVEVVVESYKEEKEKIYIAALILVERESQKGIIIGHQGKALKKLGTTARREIERFTGKNVFLELFVKVEKDWRTNENSLKNFGYIQD
jgi:GTP-binding protein Era